jgi:hypothetical protein
VVPWYISSRHDLSLERNLPHRRCFCCIVDAMIFSLDRRNSMPRPLSSCKHRHSCSASVTTSHTIDNIHTIMSKVAQDKKPYDTVASFCNVHAAAPDTCIGLDAYCCQKKRLVSSQNSPSWKQIPPKWSMLRTTKASDAPPIQNDGAKSAHSHKSPWFQATIQCTQPHDQHRSKVLVQQIKAGTPDLDISLTLITSILISFFTNNHRVKSITRLSTLLYQSRPSSKLQTYTQINMPFMWTKGFGGKHAGKLDIP